MVNLVLAAVIAGTATPVPLEILALDYESGPIPVLRSSAFYNPRTEFGSRAYWQFPDHGTARLFGAFSWHIGQSTNLPDFQRRLGELEGPIANLAGVHESLIVSINYMPDWMSSSRDRTPLEGWWRVCNAAPPREQAYDTWNDVVGALVEFYAQFDGVQMYYEIWNEPDVHYWRGSLDDYLRLYAQTATTIRAVDPTARIGGAAVSAWQGRANRSPERGPINFELISYARENDLPLDFVSWHDFSGSPQSILDAATAFREALDAAGYDPMPELVVSEWNVPASVRRTGYQPGMMADQYLAFLDAGITHQTVAAWEDFHPDPDPSALGLVTQAGEYTPSFHVHASFDRLSRATGGIARLVVPGAAPHEGSRRIVVARKAPDRYDIMLWENGFEPPTAAAVQVLLDGELSPRALAAYGGIPGLTRTIRTGAGIDPAHRKLFRAARDVYLGHPVRHRPLEVVFVGCDAIEVVSASVFGTRARPVRTAVQANRLTCSLEKFEVLSLEVVVVPTVPQVSESP